MESGNEEKGGRIKERDYTECHGGLLFKEIEDGASTKLLRRDNHACNFMIMCLQNGRLRLPQTIQCTFHTSNTS